MFEADFRKNKDSPIAYSQQENNFEEFPEEKVEKDNKDEKRSVSRYSAFQTREVVPEEQLRDTTSPMRTKRATAARGMEKRLNVRICNTFVYV